MLVLVLVKGQRYVRLMLPCTGPSGFTEARQLADFDSSWVITEQTWADCQQVCELRCEFKHKSTLRLVLVKGKGKVDSHCHAQGQLNE